MLSTKDILSTLDERHLYQYYFPEKIDMRRRYLSPARHDNKKGCYFAIRKGRFGLIDNSNGRLYDVFSYLMYTRNISFYEAVMTIGRDFGLYNYNIDTRDQLTDKYQDIPNSKCSYKVYCQRFDMYHAEYFKQYHLSSQVVKRHVKPVEKYYSLYEGKVPKLNYQYTDGNDPCFLYTEPIINQLAIKLYRPLADPMYKWRSSQCEGVAFGYSKLRVTVDKKPLIIASSVKDGMCFEQLGIPFIAPSTESAFINPTIIRDVKSRFLPVLIYDIDKTGIESMRKHSLIYNIPHLILDIHDPLIKDAADISKRYGLNTLNHLLTKSNNHAKLYTISSLH